MRFLAGFRARRGDPRTRFARDLRMLFLDVRRLATQLRRHGGHVPYAARAAELRSIAEELEAHAGVLADELRALAGNADPTDAIAPREGHNHWQCLTLDLADLEAVRRSETELALRWDVAFPAPAVTLARLARSAVPMATTLRAMLARSDPHAQG